MACGSTSTGLVNRNGPGSAASSIVESIVKPAEATGGKAKCFEMFDLLSLPGLPSAFGIPSTLCFMDLLGPSSSSSKAAVTARKS
ncbi:hypothetical protein KHU50_006420 [Colletotrichum sp. SAR 10_65]|nr:hypothetical protein KHU50_006420 [Colletotrichum sp. SAR 10_65]KAJ4998963.1 hypothetical protein K4K48_004768 [Colletotrichum sp. SAR 10_66]